MTIYAYRCGSCGPFDVERPMGAAPKAAPCPRCAAGAPRLYTAPLVSRTPAGAANALAAQEKSRDCPDVTTRLPPSRVPAVPPPDPRRRALPKW